MPRSFHKEPKTIWQENIQRTSRKNPRKSYHRKPSAHISSKFSFGTYYSGSLMCSWTLFVASLTRTYNLLIFLHTHHKFPVHLITPPPPSFYVCQSLYPFFSLCLWICPPSLYLPWFDPFCLNLLWIVQCVTLTLEYRMYLWNKKCKNNNSNNKKTPLILRQVKSKKNKQKKTIT